MAGAAAGVAPPAAERPSGTRRTGAITSIAWEPTEDIDLHEWVKAGQRLGKMSRCSQWWLGDWVRYGSQRWGEKYKEASRITGYDVKTLRNIVYVAEQVEMSRRRDNLTWSHHAEVCALDPAEQDKWLDRAVTQRLSVADLRIELRGARKEAGESPGASKRDAKEVTCPECAHRFEVPDL